MEPKTEKELKDWLEGTKWLPAKDRRNVCVFRGNRFETPTHKPTFQVKGPRLIVMNWGKGVKIRCLIADDCSSMRELDGLENEFLFEGREPEEGEKSRLPAVSK